MSSTSSPSSSSSSSSSSSPSTSSSADDNAPSASPSDIPGPSTRRRGRRRRRRGSTFEFGEPSSRQRAMNEALPESILETLAIQVAIDAAHHSGRPSAASALARLFQVCSTWRAVSRSDPMWERLTRRIWRQAHRLRDTWHEEFIYWHRTARNFEQGAYSYAVPHFDPSVPPGGGGDYHQTLLCRCLALTGRHLACGFADGTVRLFDVETQAHVSTFWSNHGHLLGPFSRAVSGIVISNGSLTFARLDGDIYVALMNNGHNNQPRRAIIGDVINNGVLVEFAGTNRWWVGLFAGLPGRAFQIWNANNEQLTFVGGSLTDTETVMGWHMLAELVEPVGRVRVTERGFVVACTSSSLVCFCLRNPEVLLRDVGSATGFVVSTLDARHEAFVVVERNGLATVRRASTFERLSRFRLRRPWLRGLLGCINLGYVLMYSGGSGMLRVWNIEQPAGRWCCERHVREGQGNAMVANERHVAISWNDTSIHLLDFGV